jgi:hypothetical protein
MNMIFAILFLLVGSLLVVFIKKQTKHTRFLFFNFFIYLILFKFFLLESLFWQPQLIFFNHLDYILTVSFYVWSIFIFYNYYLSLFVVLMLIINLYQESSSVGFSFYLFIFSLIIALFAVLKDKLKIINVVLLFFFILILKLRIIDLSKINLIIVLFSIFLVFNVSLFFYKNQILRVLNYVNIKDKYKKLLYSINMKMFSSLKVIKNKNYSVFLEKKLCFVNRYVMLVFDQFQLLLKKDDVKKSLLVFYIVFLFLFVKFFLIKRFF